VFAYLGFYCFVFCLCIFDLVYLFCCLFVIFVIWFSCSCWCSFVLQEQHMVSQYSHQSLDHGGLLGLSPPNKAPSPGKFKQETLSSVEILSIFGVSSPPAETQSPPIENFLAMVLIPTYHFWWTKKFEGYITADWIPRVPNQPSSKCKKNTLQTICRAC